MNIVSLVLAIGAVLTFLASLFQGIAAVRELNKHAAQSKQKKKWLVSILVCIALAIIFGGASYISLPKLDVSPSTSSAIATSPSTLTLLPTTIGSTSFASIHNLNIPCKSTSDGRSTPGPTDCNADFPISLTLNHIDLNKHPTVWYFTLQAQPGGQESSCTKIHFTEVQLTDASGITYSVGGGVNGIWSLTTGQSQSVLLTFDIPQSGSMFQLNVSIQNCHYYTTYQTLSLFAQVN